MIDRFLLGQNSSGMSYVDSLDRGDAAETGDLSVNALESTGSIEHAEPGIFIFTGHVVIGVITGNDHQRPQDDLGETGILDGIDNNVAGGIFGFAFNGADENVGLSKLIHLSLHLVIGDV